MTGLADAATLAERMADAVRPVVMALFRSHITIEAKADTSPVTAADRDAEAVMRRMINEAFPDHGIIGEEHGREREDARFVWVLDPIDGTKAFVTGKPLFGTLIALLDGGRPVVGVIDMPALKERWVGRAGQPTLFNGTPVACRDVGRLADAWLYATTPDMFRGPDAPAFESLAGRCRAAVFGADCYAYGLLASGTVDLVCEASLQVYDFCALVPVVTGAGGIMTDWHGRPLGLASDGRVLAAGGEAVHAAAREVLAR
ncbi:MAG: histidinol-phosphatase [Rhodospirillales bacterium]|nr:MAG: histidinol-phosphatase [Rhodospirillales bacterium]